MNAARQRQLMLGLLFVGVLARVCLFFVGERISADTPDHILYTAIVSEQARIPSAHENNQSYHPPLYYILTAPLYKSFGVDGMQVFCLIVSLACLLLVYQICSRPELFSQTISRIYLLAITALSPAVLHAGNHPSNDALGELFGLLSALALLRFSLISSLRNLSLLGLLLGLGLLTKGSFLVVVPIFALGVLALRGRQQWFRSIGEAVFVLIIALTVGHYKYLQNYRDHGNAFISNLDFPHEWVARQKSQFKGGLASFEIAIPRFLTKKRFRPYYHSIPLKLARSFWASYVPPIENPKSVNAQFKTLTHVLYWTGGILAAPFLLGLLIAVWKQKLLLVESPLIEQSRAIFALSFIGLMSLLIFMYFKSQVYSVIQARLLLPTLLGYGIVCDYGFSAAGRVSRVFTAVFALSVGAFILANTYFYLLRFYLYINYSTVF